MSRVLVVEDDRLARQALVRVLGSWGHDVLPTGDGFEALTTLKSQLPNVLPDLIITDLEMPVMDGLLLLSILRRTPRLAGIPTLVLSASVDEQARRLASATLEKPFDPDELHRVIDSLIAPPGDAA